MSSSVCSLTLLGCVAITHVDEYADPDLFALSVKFNLQALPSYFLLSWSWPNPSAPPPTLPQITLSGQKKRQQGNPTVEAQTQREQPARQCYVWSCHPACKADRKVLQLSPGTQEDPVSGGGWWRCYPSILFISVSKLTHESLSSSQVPPTPESLLFSTSINILGCLQPVESQSKPFPSYEWRKWGNLSPRKSCA